MNFGSTVHGDAHRWWRNPLIRATEGDFVGKKKESNVSNNQSKKDKGASIATKYL